MELGDNIEDEPLLICLEAFERGICGELSRRHRTSRSHVVILNISVPAAILKVSKHLPCDCVDGCGFGGWDGAISSTVKANLKLSLEIQRIVY